MINQIARLQQNADVPGSDARPPRLGLASDPLARDIYLTAIGFIQTRAAREKSRFAAARRPEHRDDLATADKKADAAQCPGFLFARMVKAVEIDGFEHPRTHYQANLSDISFH